MEVLPRNGLYCESRLEPPPEDLVRAVSPLIRHQHSSSRAIAEPEHGRDEAVVGVLVRRGDDVRGEDKIAAGIGEERTGQRGLDVFRVAPQEPGA